MEQMCVEFRNSAQWEMLSNKLNGTESGHRSELSVITYFSCKIKADLLIWKDRAAFLVH